MSITGRNQFKILALGLAVLFSAGCETEDDDLFNRAQGCLDKAADKASANACVAMVSDKSGQKAAVIKCSAVFIGQGFTTTSTKFINAIKALDETPAGVNPTVAMASHLVFSAESSNAANEAAAEYAFTVCGETGLSGMIMFSSIARLGTKLSSVAGGGATMPTDPAQLDAAIGGLQDAEVGQIAKSVSANYCTDASTENAEFCGQFNNAVASGASDAEIGAALKAYLNN